jgi:hypothetical protein
MEYLPGGVKINDRGEYVPGPRQWADRDDGERIDRAVQACERAGGGVVRIPAGTYKFDGHGPTVPVGVKLMGA